MSNPEYWAFIIPWNIIIIGLAIGSYCHNKGWEPPRWITTPWEHIVLIMEKPFRRKKAVYEPAGIVHYGEFHTMLGTNHYSAYNQPDGTTDVYVNDELLGNYPFHESLYAIIDHAKENK